MRLPPSSDRAIAIATLRFGMTRPDGAALAFAPLRMTMTDIEKEALSPQAARPSFFRVYRTAFVHPGAAIALLLGDERRLRWAGYGVAVIVATYTLVYFFLWQSGGRPTVFAPWLAIPAESYYRYNLVLHAPSVILAWLSASATAQLVARALGGRGTFEDTFSALGLGISVAAWTTGLHDLVTGALAYAGVLEQRLYEDAMSTPGTGPHRLIGALMIAYVVAFLVLFGRGVAIAHRLHFLRAAFAATAAFVVYQAVFVIFNR